jgi:hypothetical protein
MKGGGAQEKTSKYLLCTHAHNDSQSPGGVCGIEGGDEHDQFTRVHLVADLDPDRVLDAPHELQVGPVQLAGPLPTPQKVA